MQTETSSTKTAATKKKLRSKLNPRKINQPPPHDHTSELKRLSRIKGQVEGVERMILDQRYCPDIVMQIKAVRSALRSLEANIVEAHMRHCVKAAISSKNPHVAQQKFEEIVMMMKGQG